MSAHPENRLGSQSITTEWVPAELREQIFHHLRILKNLYFDTSITETMPWEALALLKCRLKFSDKDIKDIHRMSCYVGRTQLANMSLIPKVPIHTVFGYPITHSQDHDLAHSVASVGQHVSRYKTNPPLQLCVKVQLAFARNIVSTVEFQVPIEYVRAA